MIIWGIEQEIKTKDTTYEPHDTFNMKAGVLVTPSDQQMRTKVMAKDE